MSNDSTIASSLQSVDSSQRRFSQNEFSQLTGIARGTLQRMIERGELVPTFNSNIKGVAMAYSEETAKEVLSKRGLTEEQIAEKLRTFYESRSKEENLSGANANQSSDEEIAAKVDSDSDSDSDSERADNSEAISEPSALKSLAVVNSVLGIDSRRKLETLDDYRDCIRDLNLKREQYDAAFTIAIGKMLIEAKKLAGHGYWAQWLADNESFFGFSQQYANRFMRVADRWEDGKLKDIFQYNRSQLFALLQVPEEEVQNFIDDQKADGNPIENQTDKELKNAIKEKFKPRTQKATPDNGDSNSELPGRYIDVLDKGLELPPDVPSQKQSQQITANFTREENLQAKNIQVEITPIKNHPAQAQQITVEHVLQSESQSQTAEQKPFVTLNTGCEEWYTPQKYIEAARAVMGGIDLDPASSDVAQQNVKATTHYTADDNGLNHEWRGRIWLNPPFSSGLIEKFVGKLLASDFDAAIVLTDNATETNWFRKLVDKASAFVFTTGRIKFLKNGIEEGSPTRGQCFFYFGANADTFLETFEQFGWGAKRIKPAVKEA